MEVSYNRFKKTTNFSHQVTRTDMNKDFTHLAEFSLCWGLSL